MPNELAVSDERFSSEKKTTTTTTTTNSKMKKNRGNHLCLLLGTQTSHRASLTWLFVQRGIIQGEKPMSPYQRVENPRRICMIAFSFMAMFRVGWLFII
jgi:hypothetical protein